MFEIKGRRVKKIKSYDDKYAECSNCRAANIRFTVFREYFHFWFLPLFPSDIKDVKGVCLNCGAWNGNRVKEDYLDQTRTPVYFYSGTIIFLTGIFLLTIYYINQNSEESVMIDDPQIGDVYLINDAEKNPEEYYWLKVNEIEDEKIYLIRSAFDYSWLQIEMDHADYFDRNKRTLISKEDLRKMFDEDKIKYVERNYDSDSRFSVEFNDPQ